MSPYNINPFEIPLDFPTQGAGSFGASRSRRCGMSPIESGWRRFKAGRSSASLKT